MRAFNFTEQVIDELVRADTLVIEQLQMPGFPDMICIVKGLMPIFVWVKPSAVEKDTWHAAKKVVMENVMASNCAAYDIEDEADITRLVEMIDAVTGVGKKPAPTAADEGFGPTVNTDKLVEEVLTPSKSKLNKWLE